MWIRRFIACSFLAGVTAAVPVYGQEYPSKPLRIVTSEAGGGNDIQARIMGLGLAAALGEQVVIDNRPSGVVPGSLVSKAPPNGYTLLLYNNALWIGPLIESTPYDPLRDFAPISSVTTAPNLLVVNPALPVKSVADLIALAKSKPGDLNYGASGTGASSHLAAELFKSMAGVNIVRIYYKGAAQTLNALLAGELQTAFPTAGAATPFMKSGRLKVLAITSSAPSALVPGVPTIAASGLPGYESIAIYGIFAPAGTPRPIITKLNGEIVRLLNRADLKERFMNGGMEAAGGTPEQLGSMVKSEMTRMGKVIKDAGIKAD